jgi:hypothetical protein
MSILQVWLLFGLPALLLGGALFVGRSPWRTALGYLVLFAGFFTVAVFDRTSAAAFGGVIILLVAAGRGGRGETEPALTQPEADVHGFVGTDRTLKPGQRT